MIKTSKRLISILICLTLVLAMLPMAVFAEGTTIYVQPNDNWNQSGARFAAYFFGNGETWLDCTDPDGDGIYEVVVPEGFPSVIFCRMNPATTENNWTNKWNQTSDLTVPTDNKVVYVVDGWDKGAGQWIEMGGELEEVETVYYLRGDMNGWDTSTALTNNGEGVYSVTVALSATTYQYKIADAGWGKQCPESGNLYLNVASACDVTFTYDSNTQIVCATGDGVTTTYYVAGDEALTGAAWDPAGVQMELNENGLYAASFENINAGNYQMKITTGNWNTPSWGDATESGNYEVAVAVAGSTVNVYFNAETEMVLIDVVAPVVEGETKELALGDNADLTMGEYTFTATQAGILGVNVTALAATNPDTGEMSPMNPMMMGRFFTLEVNGVSNFMLNQEITVAAGDVVSISLTSMNFADAIATINLSIREPGVNDVKWQVSQDQKDLRLVTYADSLDYSEITFNVTIDGSTVAIPCTTVYEAINAGGLVLDNAGETFNTYALYYVTFTLTDIPDALRGQDISVSVTWTDLDGYSTTSETRVITVPELVEA